MWFLIFGNSIMKPLNKRVTTHFYSYFQKLFYSLGEFDGAFIGGGSIASFVLQEPIQDYDIFFCSKEKWKKAVSLLFDLKSPQERAEFALWMREFPRWREDIYDWRGLGFNRLRVKKGVKILTKTRNAISFKIGKNSSPIQFINTYSGKPKDIIEKFDFIHCKVAILPNKIIWGKGNSLNFIRSKTIELNSKIQFPVFTLSRLLKLHKRGWAVSSLVLTQLTNVIRNASKKTIASDPLIRK
jgi:hypothetical protein